MIERHQPPGDATPEPQGGELPREPGVEPSSRPALPEGTVIGQYRVVKPIGDGGMGAVYMVEHKGLAGFFALKLLLPELSGRPEYRDRFKREGRANARIHHPNVVLVTDAGEHDGADYLVMQLLEGESLAERLARAKLQNKKLDLRETLSIILPVMSGIRAVHTRGVVHRDLKPGNIFLAREGTARVVPKVLDFGIARDMTAPAGTRTGATLGTPDYMAPEQFGHARQADERADQYALGAVLYDCLTGAPPNRLHVMTGTYEPLARLRPDLPPQVDAAVSTMLHVDPRDRYANLAEAVVLLAPLADERTRDDVLAEFDIATPAEREPGAALSPPTPRRAGAEPTMPLEPPPDGPERPVRAAEGVSRRAPMSLVAAAAMVAIVVGIGGILLARKTTHDDTATFAGERVNEQPPAPALFTDAALPPEAPSITARAPDAAPAVTHEIASGSRPAVSPRGKKKSAAADSPRPDLKALVQ